MRAGAVERHAAVSGGADWGKCLHQRERGASGKTHWPGRPGVGKGREMPLSRYEQRMLDEIETGLRADDPVFAAKLNLETADHDLRRRTAVAHGYLWLGMVMTLTGFGLVREVFAAGALIIFYGVGILIAGLVGVWQLRPIDVRRWGGGSGTVPE